MTVNKAEHLPAMDLTGLSDPFCKLVYGGRTQKTDVVRESLDPEWNESFDFEYKPDQTMVVELYDWDLIGSNDYMGSVVLNMSTVTHSLSSSWYTLKDDKGLSVPFARVNIGMQMMTESEAGIAPPGKNVSLMSAVMENRKPILTNIFRLLYVIVRPILAQLIVLRKLFIDWETPMQTIMAGVVYVYVWYNELILSTLLAIVWWNFTKRMWTYKFFGASYLAIDPDLKDKDMLKAFKDTKIELKYGRDDPISQDVQLIAKVTGKISDTGLELQAFFCWQKKPGPTAAVWAALLLLALGHSFVPWRFIFYWIFRVALIVGWFVASIIVPLLRVFPTATIKAKRFFLSRGFLSHIKTRYTTVEGVDSYSTLSKSEKELLLNIGVTQTVRADRVLVERGQWPDLFFYPTTAVLRTGHTTHVKTFVRPVNVLLTRLSSLNPAWDMHRYLMRHLNNVATMQGGKTVVFDVSAVRLEFQQNPNLAFNFYRWLAYTLTKKVDRAAMLKQAVSEADTSFGEVLESAGLDPDAEAPSNRTDLLQARAIEKRKQQVALLRDKFGVASEPVLNITGDVFRRRMGKKFYGNVFVTINHLAFLPSTISQQNERWIASADELETAFVDKNGALEIRFVGDEVRHLYHDDKNLLNEIVSHLNFMKTSAESSRAAKAGGDLSDNSPPVLKRHNIRAAVSKTLSRVSLNRSTSRGSLRKVSVDPDVVAIPSGSSPGTSPQVSRIRRGSAGSGSRIRVMVDEDADENHADLTEAAIEQAASASVKSVVQEGVTPDWQHVRITTVMEPSLVSKLLDKRLKKQYAAGSTIVVQEASREVAIQILWKGTAKAIRKTSGKPDLMIGYINEGSLFSEASYLLEINSGVTVVAVTDCVVYNLPGPWLDGVFESDKLLGAAFFEFVCLVMLERSLLTEELAAAENSSKSQIETADDDQMDDESAGL